MKIVFIGCVDFSAAMLNLLQEHPDAELVGVVTLEKSNFNTDFHDLQPLAKKLDCPILINNNNDQQALANWLQDRKADVIYCLGWSYLLSTEVLAIPPLGVIGYHPAALPKNRGRHPIIWALALGLDKTASTFFIMDAGADSGDILSQEPVTIEATDNAASLYKKLTEVAQHQLQILTTELAQEQTHPIPQDHTLANYWRKRNTSDGRIDWRMSANNICNLVRALSHPYPGAHFEYNGKDIKVWRANAINTASDNIEPGKVLASSNTKISIKCGEGIVQLTDHTFNPLPKEGIYL